MRSWVLRERQSRVQQRLPLRRLLAQRVAPGAAPLPDNSSVRSVPAAALSGEIGPHVSARQAVTVRQYAGVPAAMDAPLVSDAEARMLRRMRVDLQELAPQRGRPIKVERVPGGRTDDVCAHGAPGSPIADD